MLIAKPSVAIASLGLTINQLLKTANPMVDKTIKKPQVLIKRYNWDWLHCMCGV